MARPQADSDRLAVLRRLERHGPTTEPDDLRSRRPRLSPRVVVGVITVFAAVFLAIWAPWSPEPEAIEVAADPATADQAAPDSVTAQTPAVSLPTQPPVGAPGAAAETPTAGTAAKIMVNVVGHVKDPGVHEVPEGSRVIDVIEAAGGATQKADLTRLNLARVVGDEEYLAVLATGEEPPEVMAPSTGGASTPTPDPTGGEAGGQGSGGVLDLNTASATELETLPGVGPVMAGRIVDWREQNDGFRSVDELREVSGIGPKVFAQLQPLVTV